MYVYEQKTGRLLQGEVVVAQGWAGRAPHKNNPEGQAIHDIGPLPRGKYKISAPFTHPLLGSVVMKLEPLPDAGETVAPYPHMLGRGAFRLHGAAVDPKEVETSSHGCIVLPRAARLAVAASGDTELLVVRGDKLPA